MNPKAKPRGLSLSNVVDHNDTRGANVSYDFPNSWANGRVTFLFTIVGLIIQMVIYLFYTTKLIMLDAIIFLLDHSIRDKDPCT